jgi:large subunit ribosomal protein L15
MVNAEFYSAFQQEIRSLIMDVLSNLKYVEGSKKNRKRVGRGIGSGHGKTSCRGFNGQKSRSGAKFPASFEGGQMPIQRRIPKSGFNSHNRIEFQFLNLGKLQLFFNSGKMNYESINPEILFNEGLVSKKNIPIKILGEGEFKQKLNISAHKFSKSAVEKIEKNGGKVTVL